MDFPLPFHAHAHDAAKAARCANEQGKFWEFHDSLFANQSKLAPADLKATAKTLGMNSTKFNACFDKCEIRQPRSKPTRPLARKSASMEPRRSSSTAAR